MTKSFDPQIIEAIFSLVSSSRNHVSQGALNAAMADLVKALQFYLASPMLKKERDVLEEDIHTILIRLSQHPKFASTYGPVSFRRW